MKFRVEREPLGDAVAWVARALSARPVVPVLSGMLLAARDGSLTLSCFDYEVCAEATIEAEVDEPGQALVPGRLLAEIVRSLPALPAAVADAADGVSLACGSAEFTLVCLPTEDYPVRPLLPEPAGTVDGGVLAAAAAQVVPSASRDDTLAILTAVCLEADGPALTLAATDRYRLAVCEVSWEPVRPDVSAVALVPARTLADASRAMSAGVPVTVSFGTAGLADGDRTAAARPTEGMISFAGGGRQLATRLIAGEFVRYRSRFPAEYGCSADIPAGPLIEAVRRAALVAERASPVRLSFGPDQVVIEARAEGRARAVETVPATFAGDQPVISFDPHYLLDGLAAAAVAAGSRPVPAPAVAAEAGQAAAGRIRMQFTSAAKPALITWAGPDEREREQGTAGTGTEGTAASGDQAAPAFRYLLVPLRTPVRT